MPPLQSKGDAVKILIKFFLAMSILLALASCTSSASSDITPCPGGINVGPADEVRQHPEMANLIKEGPSAQRLDCTVLDWPTSPDMSAGTTENNSTYFQYVISWGYDQYAPGRDYVKDGLAICELVKAHPDRYQAIVNTIESQGYAKGAYGQAIPGSILAAAVMQYCPAYTQTINDQAKAIIQDVINDSKNASGN